jgi:hypothetical protein
MNTPLIWFRRFAWTGILVNFGFVLPALFAPGLYNAMLGLPVESFYPWLENSGMLLFALSLFYMPAAVAPERWPVYTWLCVLSRAVAVVLWISLVSGQEYPHVFVPFLITDAVMTILLCVTAQLGLPDSDRLSFGNLRREHDRFLIALGTCWKVPHIRAGIILSVVALCLVGSQVWYFMFRKLPDPHFASDEDHFKYAPIGLGLSSRIPLYVFETLPELCGLEGGYASLGFVYEPGHSLPIGLAQRQIGYPTVEPNCALCHTGSYQTTFGSPIVPVLASPAQSLDLEAFQWFLYECVSGPKFDASRVMDLIGARHSLGLMESLFYRYVIVHVTRLAIGHQESQYLWQKKRPAQGRGRTDTFNPTKMAVFGFPDDGTIGTVDYPQVWNQKPREGMWLHWDGNNDAIRERNYAAAMAVGATPDSVIVPNFTRVTDWLLSKAPPPYPFAIDATRAERGKITWQRECGDCHDFGHPKTGQVTELLNSLGTDPHRVASFTPGLVDKFHTFESPPFVFGAYRKTESYSNTPTDGIWARAPYLHNGSVPTLWDLLQPPAQRPTVFLKGFPVYDPEHVGFVSGGAAAEKSGFRFDTGAPGNDNGGHLFGTALSDAEKWDLIEYMKTL